VLVTASAPVLGQVLLGVREPLQPLLVLLMSSLLALEMVPALACATVLVYATALGLMLVPLLSWPSVAWSYGLCDRSST